MGNPERKLMKNITELCIPPEHAHLLPLLEEELKKIEGTDLHQDGSHFGVVWEEKEGAAARVHIAVKNAILRANARYVPVPPKEKAA